MGIIKRDIKNLVTVTKDAGRGFRNSPLYPINNLTAIDLMKGWVYTCMNIRATELANSNFVFEDNKKEIVNEGHWALLLKENPNPYYTWFDMLQLVSFWLDLEGNAYILPKLITKGGVTFPISFTVLPANRVFIEVNETLRYRVTLPNNKSVIIAEEDIIHIKDMSPSPLINENYFKGSAGSLNSIKDVQEIYSKRLDYIESFYEGDGVMPYVMTTDSEELGIEEANQIFSNFNAKIENPKYRMQAFLPSNVTPKSLGEIQGGQGAISSEDNESIRTQIGAAYGIADTYLTGKYNGKAAAYDTIQVMNEKNTTPRANKIAYYFNQFFSRYNNVRIKHEPIPFRNDEFELRKTSTMYKDGAIDVDEYRKANGYEPIGLVNVNEKKTLN